MKKVILGAAAVAAIGLTLASTAQADELWDAHLRGVDEGLAAGAIPPKGVYFVDDNYFVNFKRFGGPIAGAKLDSYVNVPIVLWNPGIKLLGADYAAAIAQPFDFTNLVVGGLDNNGTGVGGSHWGTYNTVLVPAMLSWALPYDLHVKGQFAVYLNDGSSSSHVGSMPAGGIGSAMANTTFEPGLGISWLHNGWNVSASMGYDTATKDSASALAGGASYQSGDEFFADYTVAKEIGKWTVGLVGFQTNQLQKDQIGGVNQAGTTSLVAGVGPMIGYTFGGIIVQSTFNHDIVCHNDVGGDFLNVRFIVPLY